MKMPLDPLELTDSIKSSYIRYLTTTFHLRKPELMQNFWKKVHQFNFVNGPILEATPPFLKGCFLKDLIQEGVLEPLFEKFIFKALPYLEKNPLYLHQERAIRKVTEGRNVVITSGTGSGKTECFLIPIYNSLIKEFNAGTLDPGVRALLLYPMNALVNDQLRRLRQIAKAIESTVPDLNITFGRYIGDTPETQKDGEDQFRVRFPDQTPSVSELLSRNDMRQNPPHLLITNYAMLEYLLLRPKDCPFFDDENGNHWKFIVLDESHIYSGASGIEMAMLLRRLKERICRSERGVIQAIGTSATLARDERDFGEVANFASNLFGERFEWNSQNPKEQDIIKGERLKIDINEKAVFTVDNKLYLELHQEIIKKEPSQRNFDQVLEILKKYSVPASILDKALENNRDLKRTLYEVLRHDKTLIQLRNLLAKGSLKFHKCMEILIQNDISISNEQLRYLVDLSVWANPEDQQVPLLPARYHLFVRAPEGVFISFFPKPQIFLKRRKFNDQKYPVFELSACSRCGQGYLMGKIKEGKLVHPFYDDRPTRKKRAKKNFYYIFPEKPNLDEDDEDEIIATPDISPERNQSLILCTQCGTIWPDDRDPLCTCPNNRQTALRILEIIPTGDYLGKCHFCGYRAPSVLRQFIFQQDAPAAVLATSLFQQLAANATDQKFLIFSDSRQNAAFFAPYFEKTYRGILFKSLLYQVIQNNYSQNYRLNSLCEDAVSYADSLRLFDPVMDDKERHREIWRHIIQEFSPLVQRHSLEGVGLIGFDLEFLPNWAPLYELLHDPWNLSEPEVKRLFKILLKSLRYNKMAISFPKDLSPKDDFFKPRNQQFRFRGDNSDTKNRVLAFNSRTHRNVRIDFLMKLYKKITGEELDNSLGREILGRIWESMRDNFEANGLIREIDRKIGTSFLLNYRSWRIILPNENSELYRCDHCGLITMHNLKDVCPTYNCDGELKAISKENQLYLENNHYRYLYQNFNTKEVTVHEHTAQLTHDYAAEIQQKFINGEINVLSCSTTFELGVDLGELELIFLRNVPPEPANYIQRSGRAGRRTESVGFTLTFALLRSHDLNYFHRPEKMVDGKINAPIIELRNEKILRRHLHSFILSRFFKTYPDFYGKIGTFFRLDRNNTPNGIDSLGEFLRAHPSDIKEALERIIPQNLHSIFEISNWGWVEKLLGDTSGLLITAYKQVLDEYMNLKGFIDERQNESNAVLDDASISNKNKIFKRGRLERDIRWALQRKLTIERKELIDFLASNNVIPKYGFPVDVVELKVYHHLPEARNIRLERDLQIAISEFAPGSQIVANNYIWESYGLRLIRDRTWPIWFYAICPECQRFHMEHGNIGDSRPDFKCDSCGITIPPNETYRFIQPSFGFVTNREREPSRIGTARPKKEYSSRPYFFRHNNVKKKEIQLTQKARLKCLYSSKGDLVMVCQGKNKAGFSICFSCGYAISSHKRAKRSKKKKEEADHKSPYGRDCNGRISNNLHLGHKFMTDVLLIQFESGVTYYGSEFWYSLLYAVLEGVSQSLGINRRDLSGCLYPYEKKFALVLFDTVPGGAGHVKRLLEEKNLYRAFRAARDRVVNCDCDPETSCYGCLRNYANQFIHDDLKRGLVAEFLTNLLKGET